MSTNFRVTWLVYITDSVYIKISFHCIRFVPIAVCQKLVTVYFCLEIAVKHAERLQRCDRLFFIECVCSAVTLLMMCMYAVVIISVIVILQYCQGSKLRNCLVIYYKIICTM